MVISMYFAVSWEEPRMVINESAVEWRDARTGPTDVSCSPGEILPSLSLSTKYERFSPRRQISPHITTFSLHHQQNTSWGNNIGLSGHLLKTTITTIINHHHYQHYHHKGNTKTISPLKGKHHICWRGKIFIF